MPISGPGGGVHGQGTDKMAVSVPILWLEVQQDIFTRIWRGGCCLDHIKQELPPNFTMWLAQPFLQSHQPVHTTSLFFNRLLLSCPQTYRGSPLPEATCLKSKLKCLASEPLHHVVPPRDSPLPPPFKGLHSPCQPDVFHLASCIFTCSWAQGEK